MACFKKHLTLLGNNKNMKKNSFPQIHNIF